MREPDLSPVGVDMQQGASTHWCRVHVQVTVTWQLDSQHMPSPPRTTTPAVDGDATAVSGRWTCRWA
jgi:hypothetical protein